MRYYLIDQDRNEVSYDIDWVNPSEFCFEGKSYFVKKLANQMYLSEDKKSWRKIPKYVSAQTLISHSSTFQLYRGYKPSGLTSAGAGALVTQMPGKIVKVGKKIGDNVSKGETVLILEAMKMENEIKAGMDGVITSIYVSAGQAVESGFLMAEIE